MSQAGQMTLELPYVIIGLGATPNFVEKLTIGLPPNVQSVRSCLLVRMKSPSFSLSLCLEPPDSNLYSNDSQFSNCHHSNSIDGSRQVRPVFSDSVSRQPIHFVVQMAEQTLRHSEPDDSTYGYRFGSDIARYSSCHGSVTVPREGMCFYG